MITSPPSDTVQPHTPARMGALASPLPWYGGKGLLASRLVALFPPHRTFVDVFGGAGSILFAKEPALVEVYNDVHSGLVTLWRVVRDPEQYRQLQQLCALTPYSREEYQAMCSTWTAETDPVRKAWRFFAAARMAFAGEIGCGWRHNITHARRGYASAVSAWLSAIDGLEAIHARLRGVQIEQGDWAAILDRYDTPETLFYLDPPYVPATRGQGGAFDHELRLEDHRALTARLLGCVGMWVLSGYAFPAVHQPLEAAGWRRLDLDVHLKATRENDGCRRCESVWLNPAAVRHGALSPAALARVAALPTVASADEALPDAGAAPSPAACSIRPAAGCAQLATGQSTSESSSQVARWRDLHVVALFARCKETPRPEPTALWTVLRDLRVIALYEHGGGSPPETVPFSRIRALLCADIALLEASHEQA